jgi:hypothetical protein
MNYRRDIEDNNWFDFTLWLEGTGFDPRNGESIDTLFWYWYLNIGKKKDGRVYQITTVAPPLNQTKDEREQENG